MATQIRENSSIGSKKGSLTQSMLDSGLSALSLDSLEHYTGELKDAVTDITEKSLKFVKEHPVYSLVGAAAIGFAAGAAIRQSMKK